MQPRSGELGLTLKIDRISLFDTRYNATASARHSSIDEETVPKTELEVWPGLYQDVILPCVKGLITYIVRYESSTRWPFAKRLTLSLSKLRLPLASSVNNLPLPWPRSS